MIKRMKKGFTLIELLVVIAIIALLSTLAIVSLGNARLKSRDSKRLADIKQIQTALALYAADNTNYPVVDPATSAGYVKLGVGGGASLSSTGGWAASPTGTTYMGQVGRDPSVTGAAAACAMGTAWGAAVTASAPCDYTYRSETNAAATALQYEIGFVLEGQATPALGAGAHCASEAGIGGATCTH